MDAGEHERAEQARLVLESLSGDQRAFSALVERNFSTVFLTAFARLNDREAAEDLAQEVFLRAWLHLDQLQDSARFAAWSCRIARNLAEDWSRKNQRAGRLVPMVFLEGEAMKNLPDLRNDDPRERAHRVQRDDAVRRAMDSLTVEQREIVLLHYVEGQSDRAIAERLGVDRTTVRYHRVRAAAVLRSGELKGLGGARASLRASRAAVVRTGAAVAVVAALSQVSRAAIVARSAVDMPSAAVLQAPAQAPAGLLPLLKTFATYASLGGIVMQGKTVAVGISAVVALAGSYYWNAGTRDSARAAAGSGTTAPEFSRSTKPRPSDFTSIPHYVGRMTGVTPVRIIVEVALPDIRIDPRSTIFAGPIPSKEAEEAFKRMLEIQWNLTLVHEKHSTDTLVLRALPRHEKLLKPGDAQAAGKGSTVAPGRIASASNTMESLARRLEEQVGKPVVDETGLAGLWQYDLRWNAGAPGALNASLQQLGLEAVPARRDVEYVVIRSKDGRGTTPPVTPASTMGMGSGSKN